MKQKKAIGAVLVYMTIATQDMTPPIRKVTTGSEPLPYQATLTLTTIKYPQARSHISYDSRPNRQLVRIDFYGNDETDHALLVDLLNCTIYRVDWFMGTEPRCQQERLFGMTTAEQCADWALKLPQMPKELRADLVADAHGHLVHRLNLDDQTVLVRDAQTHVPLSFERDGQVFVVTDFVPQFTRNWPAVVNFCKTGIIHGIVLPEGVPVSRIVRLSISTLGRSSLRVLWIDPAKSSLDSARSIQKIQENNAIGFATLQNFMESKCPDQPGKIQTTLEALRQGDWTYGYWCGTAQSNVTSPDPPNQAVRQACAQRQYCDKLDNLCRVHFAGELAFARRGQGISILSCLNNRLLRDQLQKMQQPPDPICQVTSYDAGRCRAAADLLSVLAECMPCDWRESQDLIVPDQTKGYLSPVIAPVPRTNQYAMSRPSGLENGSSKVDWNATLHDSSEFDQSMAPFWLIFS